jgi:hypothetical protein
MLATDDEMIEIADFAALHMSPSDVVDGARSRQRRAIR